MRNAVRYVFRTGFRHPPVRPALLYPYFTRPSLEQCSRPTRKRQCLWRRDDSPAALPRLKLPMSNLVNRFDVRMSDEFAQEFDEIQKETEMSGAEVFRRAIALYKIAKRASRDGEQVILRSKDRERELVSI